MQEPEMTTDSARRLARRRWMTLVLIAVLLAFVGVLGSAVVFETVARNAPGPASGPASPSDVHAPG